MSVSAPPFAVIDDFNRADETPLGGIWTGPLRTGDVAFNLSSNQLAHSAPGGGAQASAYTVKRYIRPFGFSIQLANTGGDAGIDYCIQNPGALSLEGYRWQTNGTVLQLYKITDNGFTKIGGDYAITAADGDELAVTLDYGGVHKLYHKLAAGSWTLVDTVIDNTVNVFIMGNVGVFQTADASALLDNFSGYQVPIPFTFPYPSVIDDFNRADANPLNTNWGGPTITGSTFKRLKIVSNQVAHEDGATNNAPAWYNVATYAAPFDVFMEIAASNKEFGIDYAISSPGTATASGYRWQTNAAGSGITPLADRGLELWRYDSGSFTKLYGTPIIEVLANDQIGVRLLVNGTHYLMYKTLNGTWQIVDTFTDTTYSSGYAGMMLAADTTTRLDNFGAGVVIEKQTSYYRRSRMVVR